jgi:hypothetical protein
MNKRLGRDYEAFLEREAKPLAEPTEALCEGRRPPALEVK